MLYQVSQQTNQSIQPNAPQQQGLIAGTTSVIFGSAKQAFANLTQSFSFQNKASPKKIEDNYVSEKAALTAVLSSQEMNSLSEALASTEEKRDLLMEDLLGRKYQAENAFDNYVYDIILAAETDVEDFQQRIQGLDKIGEENAFSLLAAGYKYAETLEQSEISASEKNRIIQSKQRFERALLSHLKKHPVAAQTSLPLNMSSVDSAFLSNLEAKQAAEAKEAKDSEKSYSKNRRMIGIALLALTLGSAAAGGYYMYQRHQAGKEAAPAKPAPEAPKQEKAPEAKPAIPYGPDYPEDMCQGGPEVKFCERNMSIPRIAMPQLDKEVTEKFVNSYQLKNVTVEYESVPAASLFATQSELLRSKVMGMVKAFKDGKFNPCQDTIVVAKHGDDHVLDGHHRWAACRVIGGKISVIRIDQPIEKLMNKANKFAGVEHHNLQQFDFKLKKV